jgi:hypothetical protein
VAWKIEIAAHDHPGILRLSVDQLYQVPYLVHLNLSLFVREPPIAQVIGLQMRIQNGKPVLIKFQAHQQDAFIERPTENPMLLVYPGSMDKLFLTAEGERQQ